MKILAKPLMLFILLQLMDVATTIVAISLGGDEKNPLVSYLMNVGPIAGLLISKLVVIGIAVVGALMSKYKGIRWANVAFTAVIIWNVSIIFRLGLSLQNS